MPTDLTPLSFTAKNFDQLSETIGRVAVVVDPDGGLWPAARRLNARTRGAVKKLVEADGFGDRSAGDVVTLSYPVGVKASALDVVILPRSHSVEHARKAGASLAKLRGKSDLLLAADGLRRVADLAFGLIARDYHYSEMESRPAEKKGAVTVMCTNPETASEAFSPMCAVAEGMFFTRDLVNAPANVLTTTEFADQLEALTSVGLEIEVLDEEKLASLGMRALLAVGQGSDSPSKVVIMKWNGGGQEAPLALVGKGVVFDTGGISLKPAAGMENMTMDMGGAGIVAGTMKALALRKAKANVVGLVGLVENMPSGNATRPGDVVKTLKGDTVEIINTDAEGRLVLCDVMWYAQERFKPSGLVDLATLTGAIIVSLGHENAGAFSNDDAFCSALLKAAGDVDEGLWRLPLAQAYDDLLKSRIADMKNVGGRTAGSITAAQFLQRFVTDGTPWVHLDVAGVASVASETKLAAKGATGWGVMTLDRFVSQYES